MPDIEIHLTARELERLQRVAAARGLTVEQLATDEIRKRYALRNRVAQVHPLRGRAKQGASHD